LRCLKYSPVVTKILDIPEEQLTLTPVFHIVDKSTFLNAIAGILGKNILNQEEERRKKKEEEEERR